MSVDFEGHSFDARTVLMIKAARVLCVAPMVITQGSYSHAAASAGTHSGGGAVDIRASDRTAAERQEIVRCMRRVGFAAWLRTPAQAKWPYHVHGIAIGCADLAPEAAAQVVDYRNDRNGLASHGKDDGPRDWVGADWESFIATNDDVRLEIGMSLSNEAITQIRTAVKAELNAANVDGGAIYETVQAFSSFNAKNLQQRIADIATAAARATDVAVGNDFAALDAAVAQLKAEIEAKNA